MIVFLPHKGEAYALIDFNSLSAEFSGVTEEAKEVSSAASVTSEKDLESYIRFLLLEDKNIERITADGSKVELRYRQKGRLLALLPVPLDVTAVADARGKVVLRYPWYSAITIDNEDEVRAKAKIAVDNALKAKAVGSVRAEGEPANPVLTPGESAAVVFGLKEVLASATFGGKNTEVSK